MQCGKCDGLPDELVPVTANRQTTGPSVSGRLSLVYCERCGSAIAAPDPTESLLAKLTQLARFGLAAGARPLLAADEPSDSRSTPAG
jgi:hypothetical protein